MQRFLLNDVFKRMDGMSLSYLNALVLDAKRSRLMTAMMGALLCAALPAGHTIAQDFPAKPITMIVPYAPGGSTDVLGRMFAGRMSELLKQQVIVENRGGAGDMIGIRAVANAPADGYTILYSTSIVAINPVLYKKPGYKFDDFAIIGPGGQFPYVLIAHEGVPFRGVGELVAYAKANPGKLNYASLGKGSPTQLFMARFMAVAGFDAVEITYSGAGPANKDLMGGQVQLQFTGATAANMTLARSVSIGITDEQRLSIAPNVPTFKEAGYPTMLGGTWFALLAPVKTAAPNIARLRVALVSASRDLKDKLAANGTFLFPGKVEEFAAYVKQDTARWETDIKRLGLALDD